MHWKIARKWCFASLAVGGMLLAGNAKAQPTGFSEGDVLQTCVNGNCSFSRPVPESSNEPTFDVQIGAQNIDVRNAGSDTVSLLDPVTVHFNPSPRGSTVEFPGGDVAATLLQVNFNDRTDTLQVFRYDGVDAAGNLKPLALIATLTCTEANNNDQCPPAPVQITQITGAITEPFPHAAQLSDSWTIDPFRIQLLSNNDGPGPEDPLFDVVPVLTVEIAAPEPSTLSLMGVALAAFAFKLARKRVSLERLGLYRC
jgi:hypothetical protein